MSYVLTDEDGNVVVIDGGWREDAEYLLAVLKEIAGREKPVVKGWFLTHAHSDHIEAFCELVQNHEDEFEVEKVYCNFPAEDFIAKNEPSELHTIQEYNALLPSLSEKVRLVRAGEKIVVGKMAFEILQVYDEAETNNAINNSSTIFRFWLNNKSVLFLGDAGIESGARLLKTYGKSLKSDFCQMAHHGQRGVEKAVYGAILPKACLWDTPDWLWENDAGKGYNTHVFKTVEVREWMQEMGVENHFCTKDGVSVIDF